MMRDQLLTAIMALLERVTAAQNPALVLEPTAVDNAQRLSDILRDDDDDIEARYVLGWFYYCRFLAVPDNSKGEALKELRRAFAPCFAAGVEGLPEPLLSFLAEDATKTASVLHEHAMSSRDLPLITTTIKLWQRIVAANPAYNLNRAAELFYLGVALRVRFELVGVQADLDEAIGVGRAAVQATPADHPNREAPLFSLGVALLLRFELLGVQADLDEAIAVGRAAMQATPADHPNWAATLTNLGVVLRERFQRVGAQADLDEAITVGRAAVQATPTHHPDRAGILSNLGIALQVRFQRLGAQADLDEAIAMGRAAVQATPADHLDRAKWLSNLGIALRVRFERVGVQADLDEAIAMGRAAVEANPANHPESARYLSNLGAALQLGSKQVPAQADLDEAITVGRAAVQATPTDHPNRFMPMSNLGIALLRRFEDMGLQADLDEAITVSRAAAQATPTDHPDRAKSLSNLGGILQIRFQRIGAQADLNEAITTLTRAVEMELGTPSIRIRAAQMVASLCAKTDAKGAAKVLERAVRLLPETAPRQLFRRDQQYTLGQFVGLANDAAALALLAHEADPREESPATRALGLLELGRGVMLSQALDTRSDLTDLQVRYPALAARFIELRDQLDQAGDPSMPGERRVEDRQRLSLAFEATVAEIRSRDGFEKFALPPESDQLIGHAQHGPVVVVNVSRHRSDAFLIRPERISSIPLLDLAWDILIHKIILFHEALSTVHNLNASLEQREGAQDGLSSVLEWLWDAAARPILDELGYRRNPARGMARPRVWWVTGGLVGFLPLHAAGYHREPPLDSGRRTVMDRVISSYTATIRALGYARERNTASRVDERALIVAMPTTPGIDAPLRHVADEAELVRARLPGSILLIEEPTVPRVQLPTRANVLAHLDDCGIAHFACHGRNDPADPSQSLLLLHDHETAPFTVTSLAPIRLEKVRLAYLSACRTAFNSSKDLIDEAIHLATAFQLAGYPHVIGTLWEINDALAVRVADTFYSALTTGSNTIDTMGAAEALHHAVRVIRDELPAEPSLWAPYLHTGA